MKDPKLVQGIISIAALCCFLTGWFNLFSPEINELLSKKVFYVLIGVSFILMAPTLSNRNFVYPMYVAAALCIVGAFIPPENRLSIIKTIGILSGFIMSIFNRPRPVR